VPAPGVWLVSHHRDARRPRPMSGSVPGSPSSRAATRATPPCRDPASRIRPATRRVRASGSKTGIRPRRSVERISVSARADHRWRGPVWPRRLTTRCTSQAARRPPGHASTSGLCAVLRAYHGGKSGRPPACAACWWARGRWTKPLRG